jgi:hypothetical protein
MPKSLSSFLSLLIIIPLLILNFTVPVYGQYDTADGHGGGGDSGGSGQQQSFDGSDNKSAANGDNAFSGNNDFGGDNSSNNNNDFQDYSSNDSNNSSFGEYVSETFGLGNEAGVDSSPGGPAPLSNQNHTTETGAVMSVDSTDEGYECINTNCNSPTLTGSTYCLANQPVVRLDWTGDATKIGYWHIVKTKEPSPQFTQLSSQPVASQSYLIDKVLLPNNIYYYGVFGSNSGNGGGYSSRTPLSNIFAVYTPSCAPVVTSSCPVVGTVEQFNVTWNTSDPTVSGYKLYRGTNNEASTRTFIPPNRSASTSSYTDTNLILGPMYNYWLTSYRTVITPAWTEITSSDENGNPTGFVDHPQRSDDIESQFSGMSIGRTALACSGSVEPPAVPTVNLTITTPTGTFPSGGIPASVQEDTTPVTLTWTTTNASSCSASSAWSGNVPTNGTQPISTATPGTYLYTLTCLNPSGSHSESIQLNVLTFPPPYIQTTGGDVHTNETINFAQ